MSDNDFAKRFEITSPCTEDWDAMIGNDSIRFCSHCQRSVHDLSQLNRKQIRRLILKSKGRLCIRYSAVNPRPIVSPGRVLYKIGRRTSILAASAFSASLGLSSAIDASAVAKQGLSDPSFAHSAATRFIEMLHSAGATAALYGVIFDPNGAVIPGATIMLTNVETREVTSAYTDGSGQYRFPSLSPGTYNLNAQANGFASSDVSMITLRANDNNRLDQTLSIAEIRETVEVTAEPGSRTEVMGGVVAVMPVNPLIRAALDDNIDEVKEALLTVNANVRDQNTDSTALEHAVRNGNREMIQLLLWAKADVNARDRGGQTVLMMLDEDATSDIVWDLLNAGAKVNLRDLDGDTALSERNCQQQRGP